MQKKKIVLFDIDHTLFDTPSFKESQLTKFSIYEEVIDVLEKLKDVAVLGVYSEGELALQTSKLLNTNITDRFIKEHIYIFDKKLEHVSEIFEKSDEKDFFLIDDRPLVLAKVKEYNPDVKTVWIRRGLYKDEYIDGFTPDKTVVNLRDILSYIKEEE